MTTTTTTLLLLPQQFHLHLQLKELHENEKAALEQPQLLKNTMGSDPSDDECKTADSDTTTVNSCGKTPLSSKRRRSIMKYRTHRDSLLATTMSSSSCFIKQQENNDHHPRRKVGFSKVEIREHAIIIGDNPGCCSGPPLAIDWPCEKKRTFDFEAYEASRPERRVRASMQMTKDIRIKLFKSLGYSYNDIVRLTKPVNITRQQRLSTMRTLQTHGLHESAEKIARGLKNALSLGRRKRQERKFLEPYCRTALQDQDLEDYSSSADDGDDDDDNVEDLSKEEESTLDVALDGCSELTRDGTRSNPLEECCEC